MEEPIRLRAHHFVCLQRFRGEGYSPGFVANLSHLLDRSRFSPTVVVDGPDDVCRSCPHVAANGACENPDTDGEAGIARIDALALGVLQVAAGDSLDLAEARRRLQADPDASRTWRDGACLGCTWKSLCAPSWDRLLGGEEQQTV